MYVKKTFPKANGGISFPVWPKSQPSRTKQRSSPLMNWRLSRSRYLRSCCVVVGVRYIRPCLRDLLTSKKILIHEEKRRKNFPQLRTCGPCNLHAQLSLHKSGRCWSSNGSASALGPAWCATISRSKFSGAPMEVAPPQPSAYRSCTLICATRSTGELLEVYKGRARL